MAKKITCFQLLSVGGRPHVMLPLGSVMMILWPIFAECNNHFYWKSANIWFRIWCPRRLNNCLHDSQCITLEDKRKHSAAWRHCSCNSVWNYSRYYMQFFRCHCGPACSYRHRNVYIVIAFNIDMCRSCRSVKQTMNRPTSSRDVWS